MLAKLDGCSGYAGWICCLSFLCCLSWLAMLAMLTGKTLHAGLFCLLASLAKLAGYAGCV